MAVPTIYDPWKEMRKMRKEMDELFENFFESPRRKEIETWGLRAPLSDLDDKGDRFVLKSELPGLKKEDINIEVDKHSITISAERNDFREEKDKKHFYCERTYSGYKRSFGLPEDINPDSVEAEYKDGVLKVTMKKVKREEEKGKKEVKVK